jgi:beta-galactosidase
VNEPSPGKQATRPAHSDFRGDVLPPLLRCALLLAALPLALHSPNTVAQNILQVDASAPIPEAQPVAAAPGTYRSANGETLSMNSRYLMLNGRPWLPVMGEFHYSRVPEADWEDEILKMKAGGVQIISVYVIWIHQEEVKGQFDWNGRRDLRHFVELCAKHHMYVYVRIGPWTHGESRNGGFPDWLLAEVKHPRTTDPLFLSYVKTYYDQIGRQLRGLLWSEGGPVMGVQLSNEYSMRGPGAGDDYILALKKLAIEAGMLSSPCMEAILTAHGRLALTSCHPRRYTRFDSGAVSPATWARWAQAKARAMKATITITHS